MRYFGSDIISTLETISAGVNAMLVTIGTERSYTGIEQIKKINYGRFDRQFPEIVIMLKPSEVLSEELNLDIKDTPEIYPFEILVGMNDNTPDIFKRQEIYIEALQRVFHGYADTNISYIVVDESIRADVYEEGSKETFKIAGIGGKIRIL